MKSPLLLLALLTCLSPALGQTACEAKYDKTIKGNCSLKSQCEGALLSVGCSDENSCCVQRAPLATSLPVCISDANFNNLYSDTVRTQYIRRYLNKALNDINVCQNCVAKAAFLAIAASMTNEFTTDEAMGTDAQFSADDNKYGNTQPGDGGRLRRRGYFGIRGQKMYESLSDSEIMESPEKAAFPDKAIKIATMKWTMDNMTKLADGTMYGFSMLWYLLTGSIDELADAVKRYAEVLRQLECTTLHTGQGPSCEYNSTHTGHCFADCIPGLEDAEYCGCDGKGERCPHSPPHVRCCLGQCTSEIKLDLGFILDASGSIGPTDYERQRNFTKDILQLVNVGPNKTHVAIINYSAKIETLSLLNQYYTINEKLNRVNNATYFGEATHTGEALQEANRVFSNNNGPRPTEDGAPKVIFLITDGQSNGAVPPIPVAAVLKQRDIHIFTVGVGNGVNLNELHAICTQPWRENYLPIANYSSLEQRLSQFVSKSCAEPINVGENSTVTGECAKDKYKFFKIIIKVIGNKTLITVKNFNGKVKLFHSFNGRHPKDPTEFEYSDDKPKTLTTLTSLIWARHYSNDIGERGFEPKQRIGRTDEDEVTLIVDKPSNNTEFVYIGVKGLEEQNRFAVKFDDCANANVDCTKKSTSSVIKMNLFSIIILVFISVLSRMSN
ncbi:unnamed protein product [Didymodactylos carnosus]|uniref:VWFA domain-containing protein n=1 Tax=Didymodactylos carnosus TaxID=1234261 RepID=A0A8S2DZC6_9BILA|nr:unnamed protein product [Didymodactylos carnosus]CAF3815431.1 unnamed protein product [Didymodactylos carnosus]